MRSPCSCARSAPSMSCRRKPTVAWIFLGRAGLFSIWDVGLFETRFDPSPPRTLLRVKSFCLHAQECAWSACAQDIHADTHMQAHRNARKSPSTLLLSFRDPPPLTSCPCPPSADSQCAKHARSMREACDRRGRSGRRMLPYYVRSSLTISVHR